MNGNRTADTNTVGWYIAQFALSLSLSLSLVIRLPLLLLLYVRVRIHTVGKLQKSSNYK